MTGECSRSDNNCDADRTDACNDDGLCGGCMDPSFVETGRTSVSSDCDNGLGERVGNYTGTSTADDPTTTEADQSGGGGGEGNGGGSGNGSGSGSDNSTDISPTSNGTTYVIAALNVLLCLFGVLSALFW